MVGCAACSAGLIFVPCLLIVQGVEYSFCTLKCARHWILNLDFGDEDLFRHTGGRPAKLIGEKATGT